MGGEVAGGLENPILNSPYDAPEAHFELGPSGPTGVVKPGRRLSESFIPIPVSRKGKGKAGEPEQQVLDTDVTAERRELNSLINDIRRQVELWRGRRYPGVTPISRKLLEHWSARPPVREDPVLFCQREAAETAIYLAEVAGRNGEPDFRTRVDQQNRIHNDGLPRIALKMATGSGKTVVIAMLIAWQTLNKVANPRDTRFAKRFLVVTPGITIRDRLRVIRPSEPGNYYKARDLVPPDLWRPLTEAEVEIVNYHAFLPKDAKEIQGVASGTRKLLTYGKDIDPFRETPDDIAARVLRGFGDLKRVGEIVVLNDEAHHCYQDKPAVDPVELSLLDAAERKEAEARNIDARVWFKGLQAVQRKAGIKTIYDLSATPFYLKGSGWNEGYIFPWTVSDFSLMDAIESGIVKIPRIPVDDDAAGREVTYLHLWDFVGKELPKRKPRDEVDGETWNPPEALQGALESLYRSYRDAFERWQRDLAPHGEPPPVFIVVCPNTTVSKLVYDWIAGTDTKPGKLPLLANADEYGQVFDRPRTILIDSAQLEFGELLSDDFKKAAAGEIEAFKKARRRDGAAEDATDADLLREVMNTVGKPGELGEQVRCVVSVSMLTEGWDANTVSHILGVRRFGSQLLCEQVVGRGLRRRSYVANDDGRFEPEYADVYGVPFLWVGGGPVDPDIEKPRTPLTEVRALDERAGLEIRFPNVSGYRLEVPEEPFVGDFGPDADWHVDRNEVATWVRVEGIVGEAAEVDLDEFRQARPQRVAFELARTLIARHYTVHEDAERPWLFPQLAGIAKRWLTEKVTYGPDAFCGLLLFTEATHRAAEKLFRDVIVSLPGAGQERLLPMIRPFDPEGMTANVDFATRKVVIPTTKSHVDGVVLDGPKGNTWEEQVADVLEHHGQVAAFVKNDHLGFSIPYLHEGRTRQYVPDFLVRLMTDPADEVDTRTLIVEVSGGMKKAHDPVPVQVKAATARGQWCRAVNNHGGWGRWGYVELTDMVHATGLLSAAIQELRADGPVTGLDD